MCRLPDVKCFRNFNKTLTMFEYGLMPQHVLMPAKLYSSIFGPLIVLFHANIVSYSQGPLINYWLLELSKKISIT